jgi:hypothetical protein
MANSAIGMLPALCIFFVAILPLSVNAQPRNLIQNPKAKLELKHWEAYKGQHTMTEPINGNPCFVIRNGAHLYQDIFLLEDAVGQYAVLIGRASTERINPDGAITGLPLLGLYVIYSNRLVGDPKQLKYC